MRRLTGRRRSRGANQQLSFRTQQRGSLCRCNIEFGPKPTCDRLSVLTGDMSASRHLTLDERKSTRLLIHGGGFAKGRPVRLMCHALLQDVQTTARPRFAARTVYSENRYFASRPCSTRSGTGASCWERFHCLRRSTFTHGGPGIDRLSIVLTPIVGSALTGGPIIAVLTLGWYSWLA